ncbi:hypothetical protein NCS52_00330700 [Fusarium sp. LHS14.1]|nr:hypothetical protein NCS52_00330700 [Fusarium sp. LHS14.1]
MPSQWNNPVGSLRPKSLHVPNNPNGPRISSNPQHLDRHPVSSYRQGNSQFESPCIPSRPKGQNPPANPQNIVAQPATKTQKRPLGKGRPSAKSPYGENYPEANGPKKRRRNQKPKSHNNPGNLCTHQARDHYKKNKGKSGDGFPDSQKIPEEVRAPSDSQNSCVHAVDCFPEEIFPKPQPEFLQLLESKGLQTSTYPRIFRRPDPSHTTMRLAVYLLRQVYQVRPALSRRYSTGELSVRDKLANTFVMGIPKHRFGISKGKDSIASAPPVLTAEYCGDPYRATIKKRLAAGKPRAPPQSEFVINSQIYHTAEKDLKKLQRLQKGEEPGLMKQAMSIIAGMGCAMVVKLRTEMRNRWIGYDEFASYHGHRYAVENRKLQMKNFFRAAMPTPMRMKSVRRKPRANHQKAPDRRVKQGRVDTHRQKPRKNQKPKRNMLCENWKELKRGV